MRAATRTASAQSAGSYRTGCASSVRRRRVVDRNRATCFGRGVPLRVCAALRVGRGKFFGKKIGYIPLLFLRIGCVNVIPILFFLPLFRFGAPFPYIRFPALRRCAEPGVSGRDIFVIFALGGLGHLLAGPSYRIIFNNIRSMKNFVRMAAVCFAAAGLFAGCNDDETLATAETVVLDKPAITLEVGDRSS